MYFRGVSSLRLSRLSITSIENALRNLFMTHLSVWCAGPWWRASARKFDFRHNISQISHETFRRCVWWKDYQNPPFSFSSAAFCLFGMEGGGGWWRSFQGLSGPEQPGARQNNAFEIEGSVETLPLRFVTFCQGKGACAVALWGRRIVVTSGCWCVVAWHISTDRTLKKLSPFQCMTSLAMYDFSISLARELENCFVAWLAKHPTD